MPNQFERAAKLYRGLQDRVNDLEQSVAGAEGIPNLLRLVKDQTEVGESVDVEVSGGDFFILDTDTDKTDDSPVKTR